VPPPPLLTSCTPTKSNICFQMSSPIALSEPALFILLTFHVTNLMSINLCLGRLSKESVQVRGFLRVFVRSLFFYGELLAPRPTPKLEDHLLSAVRDCLFNIFAAALQKLESVSFIRKLRTRHAVVTRDPPNMGCC
jgi:hypothetical protein